jgi:hypothetical protein
MRIVESFENYVAEYYISASPGSVVVPGEWYKDNVNSVNYVDKKQPLPMVIDPMFEKDKIYIHLDELSTNEDFVNLLRSEGLGAKKVIEFIKDWLYTKHLS